MITFLISFVADQLLTPGLPGRRRRERAQERTFADGGEVTIEAYVLGDRPYCRPVPVFLSASRTALHVSPTEWKELRRTALPAARIAVQRVRRRTRTDPRITPVLAGRRMPRRAGRHPDRLRSHAHAVRDRGPPPYLKYSSTSGRSSSHSRRRARFRAAITHG